MVRQISLETPLVDAYRTGDSFYLSSPQGALLTEGRLAFLSAEGRLHADLPRLAAAMWEELKQQGHANPMLVGAIPFDDARQTQLFVPARVRRTEAQPPDLAGGTQPFSAVGLAIEESPAPDGYKHAVEQAMHKIGSGELSKVVLARALQLTAPETVDPAPLLRNLAARNPSGYTFAVDMPGSTLIGASPELLVSRKGGWAIANPLAGSAARSADLVEDERRAAALLCSDKDLHEHRVVVEAVAAALRPFCRTLDVPERPSLLQTPTMWHLSSEIKGELIEPAATSLELAAALHPTPAVCGTPAYSAQSAIQELEPFERRFFTGMVGWCDAKGDGEWIVTIRCAEITGSTLCLYAGAGIVEGSTPEGELRETTAKLRTMLHALGLNSIEGEEKGGYS